MLNTQRLLDFFLTSVKIPSPSLMENRFSDFLYNILLGMADKVILDRKKKGANMVAQFNGNPKKEGITLCAHMDTVEDGVRAVEPIVDGNRIWANAGTILGADNKAAIAIFMEAIRMVLENKLDSRPIDLLLTFGEEVHLYGVKEFDTSLLRFNKVLLMDSSGKIGGIVLSSPTHYSFKIICEGKKAHAGIEPEKGINAIRKAAELVLFLPQGRIDDETTFNVGEIRGGKATNIVPDWVVIEGEFRSVSESKVQSLVKEVMELNFKFKDIKVELFRDYSGYGIQENSPFVDSIKKSLVKSNIQPYFVHSGGGSDANVLKEKGFETLNLSCGMMKPHTTEEYIEVDDLINGAEFIIHYLTD